MCSRRWWRLQPRSSITGAVGQQYIAPPTCSAVILQISSTVPDTSRTDNIDAKIPTKQAAGDASATDLRGSDCDANTIQAASDASNELADKSSAAIATTPKDPGPKPETTSGPELGDTQSAPIDAHVDTARYSTAPFRSRSAIYDIPADGEVSGHYLEHEDDGTSTGYNSPYSAQVSRPHLHL